MDVDKRNPETGKLTRFIISEPVTFGLEMTLNAGFNYGFYDGVLVKLISMHSETIIWKKKFPKTSRKGQLEKAETIIIDSIEAIVDGQLMTNVNFRLDLLTDGKYTALETFYFISLTYPCVGDFSDPDCSTSHQYHQTLEGLCIELCKYKQAGNTSITRLDFQRRMKAHELKMDALRKKDAGTDTLQRTAVNRTFYHQNHISHKLK
jgi:hypothetical protein